MSTKRLPRAALYARQSRNKTKSIDDQLGEARADAEHQSYEVVAQFRDGRSASRYAKNRRVEWPLVLAAIERREFDVLVIWEASRGDRTLTTWSAFLDLCREHDVLIRVVNDERTYDMSIDSDWNMLARSGVDSASESAKISKRTTRGVADSARAGRPPQGPCPYGYRRTYDPATGVLEGQEIDPETSVVAREIIARAGAGDPISTITKDLNARSVTPPGGGPRWYRQRVREIALSPVYAGRRVHRPGRGTPKEGARSVHDAAWPAIVSDAEHFAAVRVLDDPARLALARPGRQVYLLSYLATCTTCSGPMTTTGAGRYYRCLTGHAGILLAEVDEYVVEHLLTYVARPDVYANLARVGDSADAEVVAARDEAARLRGQLDEWRGSAAAGETSPASLASIEGELSRQIQAADHRAERAALPMSLRQLLTPAGDVGARWKAIPLAAKRLILDELLTIQIAPSGQRRLPVRDRVRIAPRASA